MKKLVIYLLLISFCGGTAETDLDPFAEEMLIAKDSMSEAQQETQKEYKETTSEKIDNCIELADAIEEVFDTIQIEAYESEIYRAYSGLDATRLDYVYEALRINKIGIEGLEKIISEYEINNDYFIIERADEALNFTLEIDRVEANGTSFNTLNYHTFDFAPLAGINYYRLKQYDLDGTYTLSNIISVYDKL